MLLKIAILILELCKLSKFDFRSITLICFGFDLFLSKTNKSTVSCLFNTNTYIHDSCDNNKVYIIQIKLYINKNKENDKLFSFYLEVLWWYCFIFLYFFQINKILIIWALFYLHVSHMIELVSKSYSMDLVISEKKKKKLKQK